MKKIVFTTQEYVVQDDDTVERVAAHFDCTPGQLLKLNKLSSRMIFTGQKILVPDGTTIEEVHVDEEPTLPKKLYHSHNEREPATSNVAAEDVECIRKFFKTNTSRLVAGGGEATGVLIVTPSCAMFDPDVEEDERFEEVQQKYGVVASLDRVFTISLYEMRVEKRGRKKDKKRSSSSRERLGIEFKRQSSVSSNEDRQRSPSITFDLAMQPHDAPAKHRSVCVMDSNTVNFASLASADAEPSRRRSTTFALDSRALSPSNFRRRFSSSIQKLRDTWRSSDFFDIKEGQIVETSVAPAAINGRSTNPVSMRRSMDDAGEVSIPGLDEQNAAVEVVVQSFEVQRDHFHAMETLMRRTLDLRRNLHRFYESLARMEKLQLSEAANIVNSAKAEAPKSPNGSSFYLLIRMTNDGEQDRDGKGAEDNEGGHSRDLPKNPLEVWFTIPADKIDVLYLLFLQWCAQESDVFEEIPASTTTNAAHLEPVQLNEDEQDRIVNFIVVDEAKFAETPDLSQVPVFHPLAKFAATPSTDDTTPTLSSKSSKKEQQQNLKLVWQLAKSHDFKRRFGILGLTESFFLPPPEGASSSSLLDEQTIRRLMGVLPARAQGYPWALVYSSHLHGFSLRTMYHRVNAWWPADDNASPTMVVVQDNQHNLFGAIVGCTLRISEHFQGSGESLLFACRPNFKTWRWTGLNNFIVKASSDSLAFGAGKGSFGLYLDADFYHGRTQHCDTFANPPLTEPADFTIVGIEVFGFGDHPVT